MHTINELQLRERDAARRRLLVYAASPECSVAHALALDMFAADVALVSGRSNGPLCAWSPWSKFRLLVLQPMYVCV